MRDHIEAFRSAIIDAGITAPEAVIPDGELHRFSSNGRKGDEAGWYALHVDGVAAGAFGCWRSGINSTWKATAGRNPTREEAVAQRAATMRILQKRNEAVDLAHNKTAAKARSLWESLPLATAEHGYLVRKGIKPHGTRVIQQGRCAGWLAVPMRDKDGKLWNIERIAPERPADGSADKMGLFQGRRTGNHHIIGATEGSSVLLICEGFATGASLHEATGLPVAVAFNAGNLEAVAKALLGRLLRRRWVPCRWPVRHMST